MMPMAPESTHPDGAAFEVLTVRVAREEQTALTLPAQLTKLNGNHPEEASNVNTPRTFALTMSNMQWVINGKQFEMEAVDDSEKVAFLWPTRCTSTAFSFR